MGKFKKWTWVLIMMAILCVMVPATASAATVASGNCGANGNNVKWVLSSDGVLTISGKGVMANYKWQAEDAPWKDYKDSITSVVIQNGVTSVGDNAFFGYDRLTSVKIPDTVKYIGLNTFSFCNVQVLRLSEGLDTIGWDAFAYNYNLTSVTIPASVTYMEGNAFRGCRSLTGYKVSSGSKTYVAIGGVVFSADKKTLVEYPAGKKGAYSIPEGTTYIGDFAFSGNKVESLTLPASLTGFGSYSFQQCYDLNEFKVASGSKTYVAVNGVLFSKDKNTLIDYPSAKAGTSYTVPSSVTAIEEDAFAYVGDLKSVTIPGNVKTIGAWAFDSCRNLTSVTIADGVTSIGREAFYGCSNLTLTVEAGSAAEKYAKENGIKYSVQGAAAEKLDTPKISGVSGSAGSVTVKWGAVTGAAKYRVFYKTGNNGWKKIADTASTSYTWTGAKNGVTYTFTVRCVNSAGTAFTSDYDTAGKSITLGQLATPQITSVKANGTAVTVTWGKVSGAAQYRLFYKKNGSWTKLRDTTATSVTLNGTAGKTYTYTVRCLSADGKTYTSAYDKNGKSITLPLATPKITSVKADGTKVTVTWGKVNGAEKYRVFYKKDGKWTKLKDTTATSVTLNGTTGKTYTYTVRCVNGAGTAYTSAYDKTGKSITLGQLATPKITSATSGANGITITWSKVTGAAQYRVFYMKDGKWTKLKDTTGTSVTITGGAKGKTYTYTVRCLSADGKTYTSDYDKNGKSVTK